MPACPTCGEPVQVGRKSCAFCNASLAAPCPFCGFVLPGILSRCPKCRNRLDTGSQPQVAPPDKPTSEPVRGAEPLPGPPVVPGPPPVSIAPSAALPDQPSAPLPTGPEPPATPATPSPVPFSEGESLVGKVLDGRFSILSKIGAGGMGSVYRGHQLSVDREVALKVMLPGCSSSAEQVTRFMAEARTASQLRSPNTVTIFDFGKTPDGRLYLAMELVEGRSLKRILEDAGRLPWRRAVNIVLQMLNSLNEAHQKGFLHRDVKPDNVIVDEQNEIPDFVKVLDFGIAKAIGEGTKGLTAAGMVLGTPRYMAPEQAKGGILDARTDLYALGVLLFELVTGVAPFDAENPLAVMMMHCTEPVPMIHDLAPDVVCPPELDDVLQRLMAKSKEERYLNGAALRVALDELLGAPTRRSTEEPVRGREDSARSGEVRRPRPEERGRSEEGDRRSAPPPRRAAPKTWADLKRLDLPDAPQEDAAARRSHSDPGLSRRGREPEEEPARRGRGWEEEPRRRSRDEAAEELPRRRNRDEAAEELLRRRGRDDLDEDLPRRRSRDDLDEELPRRRSRDELDEELPRRRGRDDLAEELPRRRSRSSWDELAGSVGSSTQPMLDAEAIPAADSAAPSMDGPKPLLVRPPTSASVPPPSLRSAATSEPPPPAPPPEPPPQPERPVPLVAPGGGKEPDERLTLRLQAELFDRLFGGLTQTLDARLEYSSFSALLKAVNPGLVRDELKERCEQLPRELQRLVKRHAGLEVALDGAALSKRLLRGLLPVQDLLDELEDALRDVKKAGIPDRVGEEYLNAIREAVIPEGKGRRLPLPGWLGLLARVGWPLDPPFVRGRQGSTNPEVVLGTYHEALRDALAATDRAWWELFTELGEALAQAGGPRLVSGQTLAARRQQTQRTQERAIDLFNHGEGRKAMGLLENSRSQALQEPGVATLACRLATLLMFKEDCRNYANILEKQFSDEPEACLARVEALLFLGEDRQAAELLDGATALWPGHRALRELQVDVHLQGERFDQALRALQPLLAEYPDVARYAFLLARIHGSLNHPEEAWKALQKVISRGLPPGVTPATLRADPAFRCLAPDRRFKELTRSDLNLTELAEAVFRPDEAFFLGDEVPARKLTQATRSWLILEPDEELIFLLDTSLMGLTAEGIAATNHRLLWKNGFGDPDSLSYDQLRIDQIKKMEGAIRIGLKQISEGRRTNHLNPLVQYLTAVARANG